MGDIVSNGNSNSMGSECEALLEETLGGLVVVVLGLNEVEEIKDLGVVVDKGCRFGLLDLLGLTV